jgi:acyl carrier protein
MNNLFSLENLKTIVCEEAMMEETEVSADSKLMEDLGIDSMSLVKIISQVSETYNVNFEDIDFDGVVTLTEAYDALCRSVTAETGGN